LDLYAVYERPQTSDARTDGLLAVHGPIGKRCQRFELLGRSDADEDVRLLDCVLW
jgi:hypothetical protein